MGNGEWGMGKKTSPTCSGGHTKTAASLMEAAVFTNYLTTDY